MIVVYSPKDGAEQSFVFDPDTWSLAEVEEVEALSGKGVPAMTMGLLSGRVGNLRPVLYVYLKRTNPSLRWKDFNPFVSECTIRSSLAEMQETRDRVLADEDWPDREQVLAQLDEAIAAAAGDEPGKARPQRRPRTSGAAGRSRKRGGTTG